eukprot:gb/GEZN01000269.1/.p1 GENE.gb/GEZN01000269.1/~~gb/GEZN01000269.1/.p1  ORF type:complete len:1649 (-),score=281.41 gb/GEZN01000269.1/:153-5099(-)
MISGIARESDKPNRKWKRIKEKRKRSLFHEAAALFGESEVDPAGEELGLSSSSSGADWSKGEPNSWSSRNRQESTASDTSRRATSSSESDLERSTRQGGDLLVDRELELVVDADPIVVLETLRAKLQESEIDRAACLWLVDRVRLTIASNSSSRTDRYVQSLRQQLGGSSEALLGAGAQNHTTSNASDGQDLDVARYMAQEILELPMNEANTFSESTKEYLRTKQMRQSDELDSAETTPRTSQLQLLDAADSGPSPPPSNGKVESNNSDIKRNIESTLINPTKTPGKVERGVLLPRLSAPQAALPSLSVPSSSPELNPNESLALSQGGTGRGRSATTDGSVRRRNNSWGLRQHAGLKRLSGTSPSLVGHSDLLELGDRPSASSSHGSPPPTPGRASLEVGIVRSMQNLVRPSDAAEHVSKVSPRSLALPGPLTHDDDDSNYSPFPSLNPDDAVIGGEYATLESTPTTTAVTGSTKTTSTITFAPNVACPPVSSPAASAALLTPSSSASSLSPYVKVGYGTHDSFSQLPARSTSTSTLPLVALSQMSFHLHMDTTIHPSPSFLSSSLLVLEAAVGPRYCPYGHLLPGPPADSDKQPRNSADKDKDEASDGPRAKCPRCLQMDERNQTWFVLRKRLQMSEEVAAFVKQLPVWDLDIFGFHRCTGGHSLYAALHHAFSALRFYDKFNLSRAVLGRFILAIEEGYNDDLPYHNSIHAADVLLNVYYLLTASDTIDLISPQDLFAALLAAAIHDFRHPGVTNGYLVSTHHPLALRYNDHAVLEQMHCAEAFALMRDPRLNVLKGLSPELQAEVRKTMINCVLCTDMAQHIKLLANVQEAVEKKRRDATWFDATNSDDRHLVVTSAIKCADLAHVAKDPMLHREWTHRVHDEFWRQGDMEALQGLPVGGLNNRTDPRMAKSQMFFVNVVAAPLWNTFGEICPTHTRHPLRNVALNKQYWSAMYDSELAERESHAAESGPYQPSDALTEDSESEDDSGEEHIYTQGVPRRSYLDGMGTVEEGEETAATSLEMPAAPVSNFFRRSLRKQMEATETGSQSEEAEGSGSSGKGTDSKNALASNKSWLSGRGASISFRKSSTSDAHADATDEKHRLTGPGDLLADMHVVSVSQGSGDLHSMGLHSCKQGAVEIKVQRGQAWRHRSVWLVLTPYQLAWFEGGGEGADILPRSGGTLRRKLSHSNQPNLYGMLLLHHNSKVFAGNIASGHKDALISDSRSSVPCSAPPSDSLSSMAPILSGPHHHSCICPVCLSTSHKQKQAMAGPDFSVLGLDRVVYGFRATSEEERDLWIHEIRKVLEGMAVRPRSTESMESPLDLLSPRAQVPGLSFFSGGELAVPDSEFQQKRWLDSVHEGPILFKADGRAGPWKCRVLALDRTGRLMIFKSSHAAGPLKVLALSRSSSLNEVHSLASSAAQHPMRASGMSNNQEPDFLHIFALTTHTGAKPVLFAATDEGDRAEWLKVLKLELHWQLTVVEGYMWKLARTGRWKRNYFCLFGPKHPKGLHLAYYKSKHDMQGKEIKLHHTFSFSHEPVLPSKPYRGMPGEIDEMWTLELLPSHLEGERSYTLGSGTKSTVEAWIKVLGKAKTHSEQLHAARTSKALITSPHDPPLSPTGTAHFMADPNNSVSLQTEGISGRLKFLI